ncbi:MAG TPA: hypothetical protein PLK30_02775 [Blastocatellia bacterium]|nr:hypothetical protein [Blastocatellia bacterium]
MLRVSEIQGDDGAAVLRLEGEVIGSDVDQVRQVIEESLAAGVHLTLDLADLLFVDREGIALFRKLAGRQVEFINSSPFLTEQLKDVISKIGQLGN